MLILLLSIAVIVYSAYHLKNPSEPLPFVPSKVNEFKNKICIVTILVGAFGIGSISFFIVGPYESAHLKRVFFGENLPAGQIIARNGQKGPEAKIYGPGFHFYPFVKITHDIDFMGVLEIKEGNYGFVKALDGLPLRKGQFLADEWPEPAPGASNKSRLRGIEDAEYFLGEMEGQKGPQLTVLPPGVYRFNHYLFQIDQLPATDVPTGHVAVIRANVADKGRKDCPNTAFTTGTAGGDIAVPVVPKGCIGVWDQALPPKRYYLNKAAYVPTIIPTRILNWDYKGGYTTRKIDLTVTDEGKITQVETPIVVETPPSAADKAINVRVEGWTIPVEARVIVQVYPHNAPEVVASIGDLKKIEDNVITPALRDVLRTIGGEKHRKVLDFVENREALADAIEKKIIEEAAKTGVTVQEVRLGEPAIPPELLVAKLREQLAEQLEQTYIQEQSAQKERIKVEKERATAEQQTQLVKAQIAKQAAEYTKQQLQLEGEGQKLKLIEIAEGQKAQVKVLGEDRVLYLQSLEKSLDAAVSNPDIVKVPTVNVESGNGSSLEGAAAVLGSSNLVQMLKQNQTNTKK